MMSNRFDLEGSTCQFIETLQAVETEINWASKSLQIFDLIKTIYGLYNDVEEVTMAVFNLMEKIKDFETFLDLDLVRHIALSNGRRPYYLDRAGVLMQRALDGIQTLEPVDESSPDPWPKRYWDHLTAEIQATMTEYGFSASMEAIYDTAEAGKKLAAVTQRLDQIESALSGSDDAEVGTSLPELYAAAADYNGVRQSMTLTHIEELSGKLGDIKRRILRLQNGLCTRYIRADSDVVLRYLAGQHLIRNGPVGSLYHVDSAVPIAEHAIHPGTRVWLLERFNRWLANENKRLIVIAGRQGSGKTALSSAVCKLYGQHQVACHFFSVVRHSGSPASRLSGMIQNLSYGLCHALPEYLNYLDDRVEAASLGGLLEEDWRANYRVLLREPLQFLYGKGKSKRSARRPLVVIDGLDECAASDWKDVGAFISTFLADLSTSFCLLATVRSRHFGALIPAIDPDELDDAEGVRLDERAWINWHIKDIEIYLASSLGAILSGEDDGDAPRHARADAMTLQNAIDELLKASSGRFDYAIELMESFAAEMSASGQFLSSLKKAMIPIRSRFGEAFEQKVGDFASLYRAYRDKEGRSVDVRVMRQSHYLMDKTRVALIRGRHRLEDFSKN